LAGQLLDRSLGFSSAFLAGGCGLDRGSPVAWSRLPVLAAARTARNPDRTIGRTHARGRTRWPSQALDRHGHERSTGTDPSSRGTVSVATFVLGPAGIRGHQGIRCLSGTAGWQDQVVVDSCPAMNFLISSVLGLFLGIASALPVLPTATPPRSALEGTKGSTAEVRPMRLSWFNSLDRSFSLDGSGGAVMVTLHAPNGNQLALLHDGALTSRDILRVSEDLPPGVYLLRIRQANRQTLDRVTLF